MFNANEEFHKKTTLRFLQKRELTQVNGLISSKKKFIVCENWKAGDKNHRVLTIPNNIDLEFLNFYITGQFNVIDDNYIPSSEYLKDNSDEFINERIQKLIPIIEVLHRTIDECFIVRPNNIRSDECLGQHNHLSPPPRKMPYNIKTQLQRIIDNEYLTARKFLTGSIFKVI
ncbi:unnamed protein product [Rhizophagus irregularis]|nr:unnamed protein product [Rhizophagus irregularis]